MCEGQEEGRGRLPGSGKDLRGVRVCEYVRVRVDLIGMDGLHD